MVIGHNNKLYSGGSGTSTGPMLDNVTILGHNNRIENLTIKSLTVSGHNNTFSNLHVRDFID